MERGFHGYRKLPSTTSPGPEIGMAVTDGNHTATATATAANNHHHLNADENECTVREQDRFMPIANVIRIMRKILPPHAKISDDAKETIQECVSEYISFITGEANDRCQREQRKTITAEDVLWAMSKLGFDDYIEPLTFYLHRYREMEGDRGSLRGEPFMKRAVDYGNLGVAAAFTRGFPMAGPAGPHPAYFGAPPMGGYFKDGNTGHEGSSNGAVGNGEAHGQFE